RRRQHVSDETPERFVRQWPAPDAAGTAFNDDMPVRPHAFAAHRIGLTLVRMRAHLDTLPAFLRQLFWVYYALIALCLAGFCVITIVFADTLAAGGSLARALCAFLAVFWTLRLIAATFVFACART